MTKGFPANRASFPMTALAAALLSSAALTGCGAEAPEPAPQDNAAAEPAPNPNAPGVHPLGGNRYQVVIRAFEGGFVPAQVRIPAGSEVTFRLLSEDLPHGFTIEKAGLEVELVPSTFVEAMHTFAEPGEYEFHCHLYCGGGHESMHGTIVVEAP